MDGGNTHQVSEAVRQRFVGRIDALQAFYLRLTERHMKNGVYYCGEGGLGKTWILEKISLNTQKDSPKTIIKKIDFFDTQNHNIRGLQKTLRDFLVFPDEFRSYDQALKQLEAAHTESEELHASVIASLEARVNREFIKCCQQATTGREVIFLFDTFEKVQEMYVGKWLLQDLLPGMQNLIFAIAGRPEPREAPMPDNVASYRLEGLSLEETRTYIRNRDKSIAEDAIKTIWERTSGVPLVIDLILDLRRSDQQQFIAKLSELDKDKRVQNSPNLQRALVGQFAQFLTHDEMQNKKTRIVWAMAYLKRRFDVNMLQYVVENSEWFNPGDYDELYKDLINSIYIKEYPELQSHLLHDEVQRMVAEYVLKEGIAQWEEMRDPLYELIINQYYPKLVEKADESLRHQLRAEVLGYLFDTDTKAGLEKYRTYRQKAEQRHDYDLEELMWSEVRSHLDDFEEAEGYEICSERGQWLRKHSLFQKAEEHYQLMVDQYEKQKVGSMQSLGFMLMRQGKIGEAGKVFEESRALVEEDDYKNVAMIENNLGQAERIGGQWEEALKHYALSLRAATMTQDYPMMVSVYINRGFLYSWQGLYANAKQQCERAIELLKRLPSNQENIQRAIYAWMNLGLAYRHNGEYAKAAKYYEMSLKLAEENKNQEARCDAMQHIGVNEFQWGRMFRRKEENLSTACEHQLKAWKYLTNALEVAHKTDWRKAIADGLHRLAHVYNEVYRLEQLSPEDSPPEFVDALQRLKQTSQKFHMPFGAEYEHEFLFPGEFTELTGQEKTTRILDVSALVADEVNDFHRALDSLTVLGRTLLEINRLEEIPHVIRRIERIKGYDYQETLFGAISEITIGDLYFEQQQYDAALAKYGPAYAVVAKESGYASYLLIGRLRNLEFHLKSLPSEITVQWCNTLENEWLRQSVSTTNPGMLDLLEQIRFEALANLTKGNNP